jgi:cyclase
MKRAWILSVIVALGGLSVAASALQAPPQGPTAAALAATKIEKVKDNLFIITGSGAEDQNAFSGGNTAVFITAGGVVIVDTKLPGWGQTIIDRIKTVTDKPITTIINTHTHGDHTGSNGFFGTNVEGIVHENTKAYMAKMDDFKGDKATFLYYFGPGHTNGDTFVVFPALGTMHAGDMFAWKALPFIDVSNGGSAVGHPQTLAKAISTIKNVDTVITGHTPLMKWNDLQEYAEFSKDFVAWAQAEMKAGKTVDQAAAEYKVPAKYKGYTAGVGSFGAAKGNTQAVFDELKK